MSRYIIPLLIFTSLLLASCGANETQPRTQNPPPKKVVSQKVVPPVNSGAIVETKVTSTGGVKYEIINGIEVPPEPDPATNNATLAGVDVNENGVRDDVERKIAEKSVNIDNFNKTLNLAKTYEDFIRKPISQRNEAIIILKKQSCIYLEVGSIEKTFTSPNSYYNLPLLTANTPARKRVLDNFNLVLGGADAEEIQCN